MTIGKYRVGITFNPGGNATVDAIKRAAADLIDLIDNIDIPYSARAMKTLCGIECTLETQPLACRYCHWMGRCVGEGAKARDRQEHRQETSPSSTLRGNDL